METSVNTSEVLAPQKKDMESSSPDTDSKDAFNFHNPMEEFGKRLEKIISTHGSAVGLLNKQNVVEAEVEKMKEEAKDDITVTMEKEVSDIMQSLNKLSSPEKKLEDLVRKYAEMAALRHCDEKKLCALQQKMSVLLDERQQLQAECRNGVVARSELETLCKDLKDYYTRLREETLKSCREDEKKRSDITSHFQKTLVEIQAQIETHSNRNNKLCRENSILTEKLESLMSQCELREKSLEKINKHRDLQQQLTEAKLQQANAVLAEAQEKHIREKEYLLKETIDKTQKFTMMKEEELAMKKKLTLYSQRFDEFQKTLGKSNEIYVRFKAEMDNMSEKMKKMEKESNVWKTRFENCNKALTDMVEERGEKNKEYELFVLKIQKLEKLCRALQEERKGLYDKIKEVRQANSTLPSKILPQTVDADNVVLTPVELQELQQLQEEIPDLTEDMSRLKDEQAKLQEFAASLLATPFDKNEEEKEDLDLEEDVVASAFVHFQKKTQIKEHVISGSAESVLPQPGKAEEAPKPDAPTAEEKTSETTPTDPKPEAVKDQSQVEKIQEQHSEATPEPEKVQIDPPTVAKPEAVKDQSQVEEIQQQHSEATPENKKVQFDLPTDEKPETVKNTVETGEVEPVAPKEDKTAQQQPAEPMQVTEAPTKSESDPVSENKPQTAAAASNANSSKKQAPKKKKKKNGKNAS
ncbi:beta-taxilin [Scomber scombrus]|uniref:Beta-taxilin n=2 Tax=Scomber scombrus TaxID=13677 RepID=A0AAV1PCH0_SCOSC